MCEAWGGPRASWGRTPSYHCTSAPPVPTLRAPRAPEQPGGMGAQCPRGGGGRTARPSESAPQSQVFARAAAYGETGVTPPLAPGTPGWSPLRCGLRRQEWVLGMKGGSSHPARHRPPRRVSVRPRVRAAGCLCGLLEVHSKEPGLLWPWLPPQRWACCRHTGAHRTPRHHQPGHPHRTGLPCRHRDRVEEQVGWGLLEGRAGTCLLPSSCGSQWLPRGHPDQLAEREAAALLVWQ